MPKILIFESEPYVANMYATLFTRAGFEVKQFEHIPETIVQTVTEEKPDIISLCVINPGLDGFKAAWFLSNNDATKDIPFIFLTNLSQPDDIEKGKGLGAAAYLIMANMRPDDVVKTFQEVVEESKRQKAGLV